MTSLRAGARTDAGRVRVSNQDAFLVARPMFAVADGMGGHAAGEVASRIAVETLRDATVTSVDELVDAVRAANRAVLIESATNPELHGMGTTLCALALVPGAAGDRIAIVNVGDSRVYVLQDQRLIQVSRDHKFVEDLVDAGEITVEEARHHPRRNIVTRALGIDPDVDVDTWEVTPFVGDRYVLCSDGLSDEVDDDVITSIVSDFRDPQDCADALTERALVHGARDNVTVVVIDVVADDPLVVDGVEPELGGWLPELDPASRGPVWLSAPGSEPGSTIGPVTTGEPVDDAPGGDGAIGGWLAEELGAVDAAADWDRGESADAPLPIEPVQLVLQQRRVRRRIVTWRSVSFVSLLVITLVFAVSALTLYARAGYTVTVTGERIVINRGRPSSLLWFHPTFEKDTAHTTTEVPAASIDRLRAGQHFGSLPEADAYVLKLVNQRDDQLGVPTIPTTPSTVSSVVATSAP